MTRRSLSTAEMLADSFSSNFWELVGNNYFCLGCDAPGTHDKEQGCPADDDFFCPQCFRHNHAEDIEDIIKDFAAILCKAVDA